MTSQPKIMTTKTPDLPAESKILASGPNLELPPVPFSDDVVAKMPTWRRWVTLYVVCWMSLPMTFMSTSIMTVTPEIAATFNTTPTTITTANAGVFVAMAMSALIWLPISTILGRRTAYLVATTVLILCSVGCALSNNMACLTALWVISGTTGPFFLVAGQTVLSDIFEPTVRGTAVGFFLGSSVSAQSITPMLGSIIATYTSWRVIFGVQGAISLYGLILAFFFLPKASQLSNLSAHKQSKIRTKEEILQAFNPMAVFRQYKYPSIALNNIACGMLSMNQYGLLSTVRHIINPLFELNTPLYSGLFYLAPGCGFLMGSLVGGNISDRTVKRYIKKRNGIRLPEDRMNSSLIWVLGILPLGTLIYGWSIDRGFGGKGVPIAFAFIQGFGLMASFSGLNTYAAEANPEFKNAVISGKYVIQYSLGAVAVGVIVPMTDAVGPGWAFTLTGGCAVIGGCCMIIIARFLVRDGVGKPRSICSPRLDVPKP